jgi:hypothetical protein
MTTNWELPPVSMNRSAVMSTMARSNLPVRAQVARCQAHVHDQIDEEHQPADQLMVSLSSERSLGPNAVATGSSAEMMIQGLLRRSQAASLLARSCASLGAGEVVVVTRR